MSFQEKFGCTLCGNTTKEPDKECPECHGDNRSYLGIQVGYVYPEEYEQFKILAKRVIVVTLIGVGSIIAMFLWMMMQIKKLGF